MVEEDLFYLILSNNHFILKYKKTQLNPPKPNPPRWQFVNDNKTMILSSAERNDSGKYTLVINKADGNITTFYTLQLNIEGRTTPVLITSHVKLQHLKVI